MKTILHFIKKEFMQLKRDPKMFGIILVAPIIQLIFLGYAANFDVNIVHTAVYDQDKTETSRNLIENFKGSGYFSIDYYVDDYDELTKLIDNGDVIIGITIPRGFEKSISRRETSKLQIIFDGSDGNAASITAGYVQGVTVNFSKKIITNFIEKAGLKMNIPASITGEPRVWYNPDLKTRTFMVPGIVALLLMIITLVLTSLAIVKEKEIGTLEQLIVTPIKSYQMILGKLIPFAILGLIAVIIALIAMNIIFSIPIRGSFFFLIFASFIYILSMSGLGIFISTISQTQQQTMMMSIFLIMLPMVYLSGFAFPIENMPAAIQVITYIIPLRYFMVIIRGVILKGLGFFDLWIELTVLLFMGLSILFISIKRFRKTV